MKKNALILTLFFLEVFAGYPNQNLPDNFFLKSSFKNKVSENDSLRFKMLENLNVILEKIHQKKFEEASNYFFFKKTATQQEIETQLTRFIEINELSAEGIIILAENGSFGKLFDIFPERAAQWLGRVGLEDDRDCYAFRFKCAEVAGKWNGERFILFRLDDVGKLPNIDE